VEVESLGSREDYLRTAREAEVQQKRAKSRLVQEAWELVIVGYLELADMAERHYREVPRLLTFQI